MGPLRPGAIVVDAASEEYSSAVDFAAIREAGAATVKASFRDGGRVVGVLAKRARGLFARFVIEQRADTAEKLARFSAEGYAFNAKLSSPSELVFERSAAARAAAAQAPGAAAGRKKKGAPEGEEEEELEAELEAAGTSGGAAQKAGRGRAGTKKSAPGEEEEEAGASGGAATRAGRAGKRAKR